MPFFISQEPYTREIEGTDGETATITLRRLNAGDQAAIQDTLRMSIGDGDASMALGTMRMLTVQRSLLDWSFPGPKPSPEAIAQLDPDVFEQIYAYCEIGSPPTESQNGTPTAAQDGKEEAAETEAAGKGKKTTRPTQPSSAAAS